MYVAFLVAGMVVTGEHDDQLSLLAAHHSAQAPQTPSSQRYPSLLPHVPPADPRCSTRQARVPAVAGIADSPQDMQCVENCGSAPVVFEQPVWQTLQMFVGEMLCAHPTIDSSSASA